MTPNSITGAVMASSYLKRSKLPRPVSREFACQVIAEHADRCRLLDQYCVRCPCGRSFAIGCSRCGDSILVFSRPGEECRHAVELITVPARPAWWPQP